MRHAVAQACVGFVMLGVLLSGARLRAAVAAGKIYWTDLGIKKIQRVNLNGTGLKDLVTEGLVVPRGIAVDAAGGKMYWTDAGTDKIQRANLDGSGVEDLIMTYSSGLAAGGGLRRGLALELEK